MSFEASPTHKPGRRLPPRRNPRAQRNDRRESGQAVSQLAALSLSSPEPMDCTHGSTPVNPVRVRRGALRREHDWVVAPPRPSVVVACLHGHPSSAPGPVPVVAAPVAFAVVEAPAPSRQVREPCAPPSFPSPRRFLPTGPLFTSPPPPTPKPPPSRLPTHLPRASFFCPKGPLFADFSPVARFPPPPTPRFGPAVVAPVAPVVSAPARPSSPLALPARGVVFDRPVSADDDYPGSFLEELRAIGEYDGPVWTALKVPDNAFGL